MDGEVRFTQVGRARVGYSIHGAGDLDIVYSPGLASHLDLTLEQPRYRRYLQALLRYGRVIRFDRRGTGVSDPVPPDAEESWEMWADDLAAVLDAAGSERAAVIAANDAGPAAMLFAATRPDRVDSLVLFNSTASFLAAPGYPEGHPPEVAAMVTDLLRSTWGTDASAELLAPSLAADEPFRRWYARFQRGACTPGEMAENMDRLLRIDARAVLPEIRCPVLVLQREEYAMLPPDQGRYIARSVPRGEFELLAGGDAPIYTQGMQEAVDRIGAFLGRTPATPADNRVFSTVLFTDIVASTETAAALGDHEWHRLLDAHDAVAREVVGSHGGSVIKGTGDGTLATFDAPTRALRSARAIAEGVRDLGIAVRAGIHAGPVVLREDGDISGLAVNAAARVLGEAGPGEVLVSDAVTDLVTGTEFTFESVGERVLKGLPGTWVLSRLAARS